MIADPVGGPAKALLPVFLFPDRFRLRGALGRLLELFLDRGVAGAARLARLGGAPMSQLPPHYAVQPAAKRSLARVIIKAADRAIDSLQDRLFHVGGVGVLQTGPPREPPH